MNLIQLRPKTLKEFQGKDDIKENLRTYIDSSILRNEQLDHCLFFGPPGVGKTSLAQIIANELNVNIKIIQGPEIQNKSDLINIIYSLNEGEIIFIDEVHSIDSSCYEVLYSIMEDFRLNINIGKEYNKKTTLLDIPKFTLIAATTKLGNLPNPFEERFGIILSLTEYNEKEIFNILKFNCESIDYYISDDWLKKISLYSKGIPRIAKRILSRIIDYSTTNNLIKIEDIFFKIGIYPLGLNKIDISYMKFLLSKKSAGLKTISQALYLDIKTIIEKIEPFLIKNNLIIKNNNGRSISEIGKIYMKEIIT